MFWIYFVAINKEIGRVKGEIFILLLEGSKNVRRKTHPSVKRVEGEQITSWEREVSIRKKMMKGMGKNGIRMKEIFLMAESTARGFRKPVRSRRLGQTMEADEGGHSNESW